jgi:hypothetical protein
MTSGIEVPGSRRGNGRVSSGELAIVLTREAYNERPGTFAGPDVGRHAARGRRGVVRRLALTA